MTDKTHQIIGLTSATAFLFSLDPTVHVTWPVVTSVIVGSAIGSLFPDIDQPTAKIWDSIPLGGIWATITCGFLGGHRNLSHSLLGAGLFYLLVNWAGQFIPSSWPLIVPIFQASLMISFIAHLLADTITVRGIPLFWPFFNNMGFPPRPFHGIRIITGQWFENLIILPGTTVILLFILLNNVLAFCSLWGVLCQ